VGPDSVRSQALDNDVNLPCRRVEGVVGGL
jgi:hypothetical protein